MLYLTLKEWLFLQSFNAITYEKEIILPSRKGKADLLTKCSGRKFKALLKRPRKETNLKVDSH